MHSSYINPKSVELKEKSMLGHYFHGLFSPGLHLWWYHCYSFNLPKKKFNLVYAKYNFSHILFFKSPWYSVITRIGPEKNYLTSCISLWLGLGFGLLWIACNYASNIDWLISFLNQVNLTLYIYMNIYLNWNHTNIANSQFIYSLTIGYCR